MSEEEDKNEETLYPASQTSRRAQRLQQCTKCSLFFRTKALLRKHVSKDHRRDHAQPSRAYCTPHEIHKDATDIQIHTGYPRWSKRPPTFGYRRQDLPLLRVSYSVGDSRVSNVMVSYDSVKKRFPRELCWFFIERTVLIPKE